jgi:uncharacterized protein YjbI with pentapeptide repeats
MAKALKNSDDGEAAQLLRRFLQTVSRDLWWRGRQPDPLYPEEEWYLLLIARSRRRRYKRRVRRLQRRLRRTYAPTSFILAYLLIIVLGLILSGVIFAGFLQILGGSAITGTFPFVEAPTSTTGKQQSETPEFRLEIAKTALTVVAGMGAVGAILVSYRKQRADETAQVREQDRLLTDRFTAAAAQLGHERAAVRLAGTHALFRVADDSPRDRDMCLSTLTAYLKMTPESEGAAEASGESQEATVRDAILDGIIRRISVMNNQNPWFGTAIDLSRTSLPYLICRHIKLDGSLFLSETTFEDDVKIVDVDCPEIHFEEAQFNGKVVVELKQTFTPIDFTEAKFNGDFFYRATWRSRGVLSLKGCTFLGRIGIRVEGAEETTLDLTDVDLRRLKQYDNEYESMLIVGDFRSIRLDGARLPTGMEFIEGDIEGLGRALCVRPEHDT